MRAMAILYIGPHRNPDFASDYHISPILAPADLLARFPPLLMSCGEKDPFVDDTVIFAGRVRDAKRQRLRDLDAKLASYVGKHGESLRMSVSYLSEESRAIKRERDELALQSDEDWVRMQIYSDWSHGYLQMPMLMQEARTAIHELADWIDEVFAGRVGRRGHRRRESNHLRIPRRQFTLPTVSDEDTTPFVTETEGETDDALTFIPKRKSPPSSFSGKASFPLTSENAQVPGSRRSPGQGDATPKASDVINSTAPHLDTPPISIISGIGGSTLGFDKGLAVPSATSGYSIGASPPRNGTPVKGQTISESELMRRRRLLDSHLIPSGDRATSAK